MDTPILDFVRQYADSDTVRFHMPGHKGRNKLGCEQWDITEVKGADALYEAEGIIARSEENATALFGSQRTLYSTEGSSQCIRAMLYLAITNRRAGTAPVVVAARNVHKSFVYAAALLDIEVAWLWPEEETWHKIGCTYANQLALMEEYPEYKVVKINVDEEVELASRFKVASIPTLVVMKNGQVVNQSVGARPKNQILAMLG